LRKLALFRFILFVLFATLAASAATPFQATTTLAAETGNNTSAADSFTTQTDGNIGASNISKVPARNLLYTGSTSKIYAQFLPWFGFGDHINVGYTSTDIVEIQKQVTDMASRGIDGAIIDWYGRGTLNSHFVSYDQASQSLMLEAQKHPGFTFAIQHDAVALKNCGCDVTQMLIDDLNYANRIYQGSPAYLHYNGRPVFFFFGHEAYPIDWNRVRSSVAGNPLFIFRNAGGFTSAQSDGGYSWVEPTQPGFSYLDYYYSQALTFPSKFSIGSAYKGFNDSLALWGSGRLITQQCGQIFLQSMAEVGKYYSASTQMLGIQLVTWNDYEEGTELETGIDNCVTVNASASGSVVSWNIGGQINTVDHFSVFVSQDGQSLMWLADEGTNVSSLDLAQFGLPGGNYTAYVKAVGKPMMTNKMGQAVSLAIGGPPTTSGNFAITAPNGATATVKAGQTATYALQLAATGSTFSVNLSCAGAPANAACNPPGGAVTVNPGTPDTVNVTVSTAAHAAMVPAFPFKTPPSAMWLLLLVPVGLMAQKLLLTPRRGRRSWKPALAAPLVLVAALAAGCGGNSTVAAGKPSPTPTPVPIPSPTPTPAPSANGTPAGTYTVVVTAISGNITHTQSLTLTVQ
jgi:hypothetical protein